jgi:hypothetical protein
MKLNLVILSIFASFAFLSSAADKGKTDRKAVHSLRRTAMMNAGRDILRITVSSPKVETPADKPANDNDKKQSLESILSLAGKKTLSLPNKSRTVGRSSRFQSTQAFSANDDKNKTTAKTNAKNEDDLDLEDIE